MSESEDSELDEPEKLDRSGSVIALAGFWAVFQVLAFLIYVAAEPDYFMLYNIDISSDEYTAWVAAISLFLAAAIGIYEMRYNKWVLPAVAKVVFVVWAIAFFYVFSTKPLIVVIDGHLVRVR